MLFSIYFYLLNPDLPKLYRLMAFIIGVEIEEVLFSEMISHLRVP